MTYKFFNRVRMAVSGAPGAGDIALGSATTGFQSLSAAGAVDGDTFPYCAEDGTAWEYGVATYHSSGSISRAMTQSSTGSLLSLTSSAVFFCALRGEDVGASAAAVPTIASTGLNSWLNQGSNTINDTAAGVCIKTLHSGGGSAVLATPPSTPYTLTAQLAHMRFPTSYDNIALGWSDGTKLHVIDVASRNGSVDFCEVSQWTNVSSWVNSSDFSDSSNEGLNNPIWLRIADDGTNISFGVSADGVNFLTVFSTSKASGYLGSGGYTHICLSNNPSSVDCLTTIMSWKFT